MSSNPFSPPVLVGREAERQQLVKILAEDNDVLVVGVPGSGRRTLIWEAAQHVGARMLEIDCLRTTSASQFLRLLADVLMAVFNDPPAIAVIQQWCLEQPVTLEQLAPPRSLLVWHLAPGKEWSLFEALLALPQRLAECLGCRVVMVFQNFPHIRSWDRQGKWEAHLRQEIQRQSQVSYALVATVAEPWAYASNLAVIHLYPLKDEELAPWLVEMMVAKGLHFEASSQALALFLSYVQGHVGDAITLARRICLEHAAIGHRDSPGVVCAHHVHRSIVALVEDLTVTFEALILLLPPSQVRVLESLAIDPTDSPQSQAYIKKHQLSRGGGLQGALNSLEQKGLIYGPKLGYRIALPLLDFWLKQRLR